MKNNEKWDRRFLDLAEVISTWSKDPSTKVGAVIADDQNRVLSVGYNGPAPGVDDAYAVLGEREVKIKCVIHAEVNAITHSNIANLMGATMYCTHLPCPNCASLMISKRISRVVVFDTDVEMAKRWNWDISAKLLEGVGIKTLMYKKG